LLNRIARSSASRHRGLRTGRNSCDGNTQMQGKEHTRPDKGTRAVCWRGNVGKRQGIFTSERAVAGGLSVWRNDGVETLVQ